MNEAATMSTSVSTPLVMSDMLTLQGNLGTVYLKSGAGGPVTVAPIDTTGNSVSLIVSGQKTTGPLAGGDL